MSQKKKGKGVQRKLRFANSLCSPFSSKRGSKASFVFRHAQWQIKERGCKTTFFYNLTKVRSRHAKKKVALHPLFIEKGVQIKCQKKTLICTPLPFFAGACIITPLDFSLFLAA